MFYRRALVSASKQELRLCSQKKNSLSHESSPPMESAKGEYETENLFFENALSKAKHGHCIIFQCESNLILGVYFFMTLCVMFMVSTWCLLNKCHLPIIITLTFLILFLICNKAHYIKLRNQARP